MFDMDDVIDSAIYIAQDDCINTAEAIDAIALAYDLDGGERRNPEDGNPDLVQFSGDCRPIK